MKSRFAVVCLLACVVSAGCDLPFLGGTDKDTSSPTGPTNATTSMDAFAGTWSSITVANPATGCGNVKYIVTPTNATSANVTFTATCAGNIAVSGSGAGTLSGDAINWSATGLVSQGGVNCPFSFSNGKATLGADGNVTVTYSGTVCGIPVSGTEVVKK
jgi:hypothetical protein